MEGPVTTAAVPEFERPIAELLKEIDALQALEPSDPKVQRKIQRLRKKLNTYRHQIYSRLTPWEIVQVARHPQRPYTLDYIRLIFDDFIELRGDRRYGDDPAIVAGLAFLGDQPMAVVGHQKGRDMQEKLRRNFGMPHPEGYRKALRVMKLAEKFGRPVVTFIDTPGAYPGIGAEARGQAQAIAENLQEMSRLRVPILVFVIGEGGSGGALGIAVGDRIYMLQYAIYSVISPEGCASILWRDATKAREAAQALRLTAQDLLELGVIDEVLEEPLGGAHADPEAMALRIKDAILRGLQELCGIPPDTLVQHRYEKFRRMGVFDLWRG
ncbi:MAG: acetyl-CoA carboxylase carboxyltransferase subunit alpha [Acidobacteria bacterium]|nr:acetyl-CoA carboxylase carboxyltransferase subunit alpha [Acidobacteriota bacterium]MDW7984533.1 acetyl-CoA carboxylase carboxyltransferase subunit alpha [Acidobacteriota bacterium]